MKRPTVQFEVCIDSVHSALAAERGGADRLELCGALSEGGITPSYGMVQAVLENSQLPVMMMIRCRGGSFVYSDQEVEVMLRDVQMAHQLQVQGVVFGALTSDGLLDIATTQRVLRAADPLEFTFHRAFDEIKTSPLSALQQLEDLGVDRLLTSGLQDSALDGQDQIAALVEASNNVQIMAGAGIGPENARQIVAATRVAEIHGTASRFCKSTQQKATCEQVVRDIRQQLEG